MPRNPLAFLDGDVWTTQDGRKLQPADMETNHIHNVRRMLMRIATWRFHDMYLLHTYVAVDTEAMGDGAADAFLSEMDAALKQTPVQWMFGTQLYTALTRELAAREALTDAD